MAEYQFPMSIRTMSFDTFKNFKGDRENVNINE